MFTNIFSAIMKQEGKKRLPTFMPKNSVFCVAQTDAQAVNIIQHLKAAGFQHQDISILFPDKLSKRNLAHHEHTRAPEGLAVGASTGGALGAALGWLAGVGALAIPGAGPFIAAGPLLGAMNGIAVGAAFGGITGTLVGMGMPERAARRYEGKIKAGSVLISVHSERTETKNKVKDIFERTGAEDISATDEHHAKTRTRRTRKISAETTGPVRREDVAEPTPDEIAARARQIYIARGRPEGHDMDNWLEAEAQLKSERRSGSKASAR